jgi:cyclohexyl-isocyanide hydratase
MKKKITKPLVVAFPLFDDVTLMDFCGATEVFAFPPGPESAFKPIWLAKEMKPILTSEGTNVYPNDTFKNNKLHIDILFVPGGGAPGVTKMMFDKEYQDFIKKTAATATWVGSVCVGAFILTAAGVLKNCKATTYWSQVPNLALMKKKFNLKIPKGNPRGVIDAAKKRFTGGGITSSLDLSLMLLEKIIGKKGRAYAQKSQLYIQYAPNPPVHAGDPEQAPKKLVAELIKEGQNYNQLYFEAVQKVLGK